MEQNLRHKNRRCPKSQQVQSVECSNVAAVHAALMIERTQRPALESVGGAGLLWLNEAAPSRVVLMYR
jgi:hypothetical protein